MSKVLWVIQENLNMDDLILLPILDKHGIDYKHIKIIPFSDNIPDVEHDGPIIVRGSTTTLKGAEKKGWLPGVWHNDNFKPSWYKESFQENFLNHAGLTLTLDNLDSAWDSINTQHIFVRPNSDYKEFTGGMMDIREARKLVKSVSLGQFPFDSNLELFVAPGINIINEFRFTIVDKKVIAGASYRVDGKLRHIPAPQHLIDYAQSLAKDCDLAEVYSLDIGETKGGNKGVVECNCFNASGIYGHSELIVTSVTDFVNQKYK